MIDPDTDDSKDDEIRNLQTLNWMLKKEVDRLLAVLSTVRLILDEQPPSKLDQFKSLMSRKNK
jgi:hypothetical protein